MATERFREIKPSLEEIEKNSDIYNITQKVLTLIRDNPKTNLNELSVIEAEVLEKTIPKLQDLGLIFPHSKGYSLSPLGKYCLNTHKKRYL